MLHVMGMKTITAFRWKWWSRCQFGKAGAGTRGRAVQAGSTPKGKIFARTSDGLRTRIVLVARLDGVESNGH